MGGTRLHFAHYCADSGPESAQDVSALLGHWRLNFSSMEETEGVSQILFPYRLLFDKQLYNCHGAHTREEQEHGDKDVNSNNNI